MGGAATVLHPVDPTSTDSQYESFPGTVVLAFRSDIGSTPAMSRTPGTLRAGVLLLLAIPAMTGATLRFEEGVARNPDYNAVLYREQHWLRSVGDRPVERLVLYLCPDGQAFGRKQVDYRRSTAAPAFRFDDSRSGYSEGLRDEHGPEVFFRPGDGGAEKSAALRSKQLVVDAGFDEFIRSRWQTLMTDEPVALDFALPGRQQSVGFMVRRIGPARIAGESAWVFRLRIGGLLGWVAPHIDVAYGQQSRRLLRFEGVSNIRDDSGRKHLLARIDFPQPSRPVADGEWQTAMKTRLLACPVGH